MVVSEREHTNEERETDELGVGNVLEPMKKEGAARKSTVTKYEAMGKQIEAHLRIAAHGQAYSSLHQPVG